jgi:hypothetical protein
MWRLRVTLVLFFALANIFFCMRRASADEAGHLVVCEYDQGSCKLHDLKELAAGPYRQGVRLWFGRQVTLKCSFHVFTHRNYPELSWIDASGVAVSNDRSKPSFYAHNVAFLDADENLIACRGDSLTNGPIGNEPTDRELVMHIPRDYHREISQYKTAYYESGTTINTRAAKQELLDGRDSRELGAIKGPLKINTRHRLLFKDLPRGAHAYALDGFCKLSDAHIPNQKEEFKDPPIFIGSKSSSQTKIYLRATDDKGPVIYYSVKNNSEFTARQDTYIAFFDDDGRLIASTSSKCETAPNAVSPSVSVDGVPQANATAFSTFLPMLLPQGHHRSITSFKIAVYVYHMEP